MLPDEILQTMTRTRFQSEGMTSTYVLQVTQKGQASPAEEIVLTYNLIGLPHTARLTVIVVNLLSFLRNVESTPIYWATYLLNSGGSSFVPGLCEDGLATVSRLNF